MIQTQWHSCWPHPDSYPEWQSDVLKWKSKSFLGKCHVSREAKPQVYVMSVSDPRTDNCMSHDSSHDCVSQISHNHASHSRRNHASHIIHMSNSSNSHMSHSSHKHN